MTKPLRVLIVSPHFPPVVAPDHQRVRLALPTFAEEGIEAHVLACTVESIEGAVVDPFLLETLPPNAAVTRVDAFPWKTTRRFGAGSLALRAYRAMARAGDQLLASVNFDHVFFSTTQFAVLPLAIRWKKKFGISYSIDFQDPWGNDSYRQKGIKPPGGWKFALSQVIARLFRDRVVKKASGLVRVSDAYDYEGCQGPVVTIPFGSPNRDFAAVGEATAPTDGPIEWVAIGRGGADLRPGLSVLFRALAKHRPKNLRLRFLGTSYAPAGQGVKTIEPLAVELGAGDYVTEEPTRIPYKDALRGLKTTHGIIIPGSADSRYNASKIGPCLMSGKPLLLLCPDSSPMLSSVENYQGAHHLSFQADDTAAERAIDWMSASVGRSYPPSVDFLSDREMTRQLAEFLRAAHRSGQR
jgi:hypothetical protein